MFNNKLLTIFLDVICRC